MPRMPPYTSQLTIRVQTPDRPDLILYLWLKHLVSDFASIPEPVERKKQSDSKRKRSKKSHVPCGEYDNVSIQRRAVCEFEAIPRELLYLAANFELYLSNCNKFASARV